MLLSSFDQILSSVVLDEISLRFGNCYAMFLAPPFVSLVVLLLLNFV